MPLTGLSFNSSGLGEVESPHGVFRISDANGCGCIFRKSLGKRAGGFVPLPVAFCMEEVDMKVRLLDIGGVITHDARLRVIHDHQRNAM